MTATRQPRSDATPAGLELFAAASDADYAAGRALIEEYAAGLGVDLCFQNLSEELANLRAVYGPPGGSLLLARRDDALCGCIAIRSLQPGVCEMKRLYVRPQGRGTGLGRRLADAAIAQAKHLGYTRMVLDTLPQMRAAQALYASLGFREIAGYYENPLADVRYLALDLSTG